MANTSTHPLFECGCHFSRFRRRKRRRAALGREPARALSLSYRRCQRRHRGNHRDRRSGAVRSVTNCDDEIQNHEVTRSFIGRYCGAHRGKLHASHIHIEEVAMTKLLTRVALLAALLCARRYVRVCAAAIRTHSGHGIRSAARRHTGRHRDRDEPGDEHRQDNPDRCGRQLRHHAARSRQLQRQRRDLRLSDSRAEGLDADCRTGRPSRAGTQSRRAVDGSAGRRRNAAAQHRVGDAEPGHHQRTDRRSAAQRQRLSRAGAPDVGRRAAAADRQHAAGASRGRERQRHRRRRRLADAVSPRRRRHHRRAPGRAPGFRPPSMRFRNSACSRTRTRRNSTAPAPRST